MSCAVGIGLSVAGAACELAGLGLVAFGIARDRSRARDLFTKRLPGRPPERSYPGRRGPSTPLASYGEPRASEVSRQVARLEASVANVLIAMREAVDTELDRSVAALRQEIARNDDELRDNLSYLLAGSVRERVIGVVLLGLGILLALAGSIVGALN
jgi:hypothetical protein